MSIINEKFPILGAQAPDGTCVGTASGVTEHMECCAEAGGYWGGDIHACSTCSDNSYFDQVDCEANGEVWTAQDPFWDPGMGNVTTLEGGDYAYLIGAKTLFSEDTFHGYAITDYHVMEDGSFTYDATKPAKIWHGWTDDRVARSEHLPGEIYWNPTSVTEGVGDTDYNADYYVSNSNLLSFWDTHEGLFVQAPTIAMAPQKKMLIDKYSMGFDEMALNLTGQSRLMWGPGVDGWCENQEDNYTDVDCALAGGTWLNGSASTYNFANSDNYDRNGLWNMGNYDDVHGQLPNWFGFLISTGGHDFTNFGPDGSLSRNAGWFIGDLTRWDFITNKGWSRPEAADDGESWGRVQHGQTSGTNGQDLGDFGAETYGHMGNAVVLKADATYLPESSNESITNAPCLIGGYFKIEGLNLANTVSAGSAAVSADMGGTTPGSHYDMLRDGTKQASITAKSDGSMLITTLRGTGDLNIEAYNEGRVYINSTGNTDALAEDYVLQVTGGIWATGDINSAGGLSDERLKKNITVIGDSLSKIEAIRGVSFDWKAKSDDSEVFQGMYEGHDLGVIAQEVEKVLPEIVNTRENGAKVVKYEKLIPVLVEAVKELNKKVTNLESQLNKTSF